MRKLLILLLIIVSLAGCKKIHLTTFNITNSTEFVIPAATPVGLFSLPVQTSSQNSFKSQGTDASHLKEVSLDKLSLTITNPTNQNFNFLDKIHIYISASGQAEQEIAYLDPIPHNGSVTINLNTTGIALVEYIKQDIYTLRISTSTNQVLTQNITIKADMTFKIKPKFL
ncbi:MAG TPA: hypothetical protein VNW99_09050 [Cytophagaceae bacterium]|nr:hypothetical protein [Cytophagaceae bacterium]